MWIEVGPAAAILVLAIVTYATRVGGLLIMEYVSITPRVERFLSAVAGSVLIALVAPAVMEGDEAVRVAVAVAIAVFILSRSAVAAMAAALAVAIALRTLVL